MSEPSRPTSSKKRPYLRPTVRQYGTLATLTRTVGNMGIDDGGAANMMMTGN